MLPLVEFPEIVQHYSHYFEPVFSADSLIEFQRYLSGLIVSDNKTVEGINRLFVLFENRNQSSLNRFLTDSPFSVSDLNQARLGILSVKPETRFKPKGVLSLDDTLLTHYGEHFEQIAKLFDPVFKCYCWAHNLVNLHYSDDKTDYPVLFRLWKPADLQKLEEGLQACGVKLREGKLSLKENEPKKWRQYLLGLWRRHQSKAEVASLYQSKLLIAEQMLSQFVEEHPCLKLPVTFDSWYTQPAFCRFIDKRLALPYVGTLDSDARIKLKTGEASAGEFADRLKQQHLESVSKAGKPVFGKISFDYKGERERYFSYCCTTRVKNFGRVRLVINHSQAELKDSPKILISNRLNWQATGITRIRRHRWPVEVYHEEGKEEGLAQYQVREFEAIYRHIALVAVAYSILKAAEYDRELSDKLQRELKIELEGSVPFWRRAAQAQSLLKLALFISAGLAQGQTVEQIMRPLMKAMCY